MPKIGKHLGRWPKQRLRLLAPPAQPLATHGRGGGGKQHMIKAVIFDMDGVIVDSEPIESLALEKMLREYGKTPMLNETGLAHIPGVTSDRYWESLMEKYNFKENVTVLRERKREIFVEIIQGGIYPITGTLELIKKLKNKIAVASSRFLKHVFLILELLEIKKYFNVVTGPTENLRRKPFPDIYLEAAKALGVPPTLCVALEDTETGILSAKNAGMKVIAVPNQYTKHQNLSKADKIVNSLSEITISMLKSL